MQSSPKHNPVPTEQRENRADANPNRPLTGERVRKDLPGNMCLRHFVLAPKASLRNFGQMVLTTVRNETSLCVLIHHRNRKMVMINAYGNFHTT